MKKSMLALLLVLAMMLSLFVGCGGNTESAAPAESEKDDAQTEQEAPEAQGETPAEPEKPANGSFSGRWDSFSAPSDRKDDK